MRSQNPSASDLVLGLISLDYHETLMAAAGTAAEKARDAAVAKGGHILIVEGSVPTGIRGACTIGGQAADDILKNACPRRCRDHQRRHVLGVRRDPGRQAQPDRRGLGRGRRQRCSRRQPVGVPGQRGQPHRHDRPLPDVRGVPARPTISAGRCSPTGSGSTTTARAVGTSTPGSSPPNGATRVTATAAAFTCSAARVRAPSTTAPASSTTRGHPGRWRPGTAAWGARSPTSGTRTHRFTTGCRTCRPLGSISPRTGSALPSSRPPLPGSRCMGSVKSFSTGSPPPTTPAAAPTSGTLGAGAPAGGDGGGGGGGGGRADDSRRAHRWRRLPPGGEHGDPRDGGGRARHRMMDSGAHGDGGRRQRLLSNLRAGR